ncbi:MAG: ribonuclease HI family protein [Methanolinea sp.]|nr:ribonuclease HI family protein [Methanolinea sp.]
MISGITSYTDGASRGNPGPSAAACILCTSTGEVIGRRAVYLGKRTNNEAEYCAVLLALRATAELGTRTVHLISDSELVIRQLRGEYRVRSPTLRPLYERVKSCEKEFSRVIYGNLPRDDPWMRAVDRLCNETLDTPQPASTPSECLNDLPLISFQPNDIHQS